MKAIGHKPRRALALLLTAGTALAGALVVEAPPAWAGDAFGFFGGFMGGMMGGPPRERYYYGSSSHHHRSGGGYQGAPRSSAAAPTPAESSSALAALAPPTSTEQSAVLKSVVPIRGARLGGRLGRPAANQRMGPGVRTRLHGESRTAAQRPRAQAGRRQEDQRRQALGAERHYRTRGARDASTTPSATPP